MVDFKDPVQKAEYMARWAQARHAQRLKDGLCTKCGLRAPEAGRRVCETCKDRLKETRRKFRDSGRCSNCGGRRRTKKFTYCKACRLLRAAEYHRNRDVVAAQEKARKQKLKREIFEAYGGARCACCGESHIEFLSIDHVDGNGAAHRKQLKLERRGGGDFYYWLKRNKFPKGFRVLCMNCNFATGRFGICPHQREHA